VLAEPAKGRKRWLLFGCAVLLAAAIAAGWFFLAGPSPPHAAAPSPVATAPPSSLKPNQPPQPSQKEADFTAALTQGRDALAHQDYSNALAQARTALALKPGDPAATQLANQAQRDLDVASQALAQQQKYEAAIAEAQAAFGQKDFSKTISQAELALSFRSNDATALKLKTDAQHELDLAAQAKAAALAATPATVNTTAPPATASTPPATGSPPASTVAVVPAVATTVTATTATTLATRDRFTNSLGMRFVWLPSLRSAGAWLGETEVSQKQFRAVMGLPSPPPGQEDLPAADISFVEAQQFCERLSQRENKKYSLPTNNDWLAAAGLTAAQVPEAWKILSAAGRLKNEVTSLDSKLGEPARVGSRGPQANGLCDLFGNLREWTADAQSAGFSYNSAVGRTTGLFLSDAMATDTPWIKQATGLRCLLVDNRDNR